MPKNRLGFVLQVVAGIIIAAMLGGCNLPGPMGSTDGSQPAETNLPADVCMEPPELNFDIAAASRAPTLPELDPNTPPELGTLGSEGAVGLAAAMAPTDSFCSLVVSDSAELVISRAMKLIEQGKSEQARQVLAEWFAEQSSQWGVAARSGHMQRVAAKLAAPAQSGDSARQVIRDLVNAAAADQAAGGDGSSYSNAANQAFRDMFAGEIGDAGFEDSMRLAEEAWRLGENELGETAANRARKIWEEKLKADIEDFDPCTATKEQVSDLLNSLAQAMLLGVQGSFDSGGQYYDAVVAKSQTAINQLTSQAAAKAGFTDLASPPPECTVGGDFELRQTLPYAKEPCVNSIPFTLTWQGNTAKLEGDGATECTHVEYNLGGSPGNMHQESTLTLSFSGTATAGTPGTLQVTLTTTEEVVEYFSGFPKEQVPLFTEASPFRVSGEGTFPLTFEFREGAQAEIINPKSGLPVLVFVLHLITTP